MHALGGAGRLELEVQRVTKANAELSGRLIRARQELAVTEMLRQERNRFRKVLTVGI